MEQDTAKTNESNSTTFPIDQEYQEANRMEMFHKYKAEIYEHKKSEIRWKQKYERMKPMIHTIDKKAKNKDARWKRANEKRKQKRKQEKEFKISLSQLQLYAQRKGLPKTAWEKWHLLWFLKKQLMGPKGRERPLYSAPGKLVSMSLLKGLSKNKIMNYVPFMINDFANIPNGEMFWFVNLTKKSKEKFKNGNGMKKKEKEKEAWINNHYNPKNFELDIVLLLQIVPISL